MKRFAFIFVVLVLGCGSDQSSQPDYVARWQQAEAQCPDISSECNITGNFALDLQSVLPPFFSIDYEVDDSSADYWKPSCQTIADQGGDCEDMAILVYRTILDSCLGDHYDIDVRIRRVDVPGDIDHVICVVYHDLDVYEIDNLVIFFGEQYTTVLTELDMYHVF